MKLEPITRETDLDEKGFLEHYFSQRRPVVLTNFLQADCRALKEWDNNYLKQKAGSIKVKLYGREDEFNDFVTSPPVVSNASFAEYLDMISNGPTELRLFLFNLLQKAPSLKKDIVINDITGGKVLTWLPYLFFGGAGSTVRYHYDIDMSHVFLSQLEGEKEVWLFAPDQSALLYQLPFNFHGVVNLRNPDYENYPGARYLQGLKCTLKKGDTLYIPAGYWHYIQYTTGGYSVSYRVLPASFSQKLTGFRNIFVTRKIDNLMREMFKEKWFHYKLKRAHRIAERKLAEIKK